jgi:kynurenine formamidase
LRLCIARLRLPETPYLGVHGTGSRPLEELAREGVHEFLFVALPIKIRGATGSMMDPIAVI